MNDEAIKKALECCLLGECKSCPIIRFQDCRIMLKDETISLLNRQQERIEELEIITGLANNRKYYRKFVDEVFCKQKGNELSEPDFDYIYQLYFEQQAEIEKWKVEYTRACAERDARICTQDYFKSEAIKEFAERLKKEVVNIWFGVNCTGETDEYKEGCLRGLVAKKNHVLYIIDNLLEKMAGEQDA